MEDEEFEGQYCIAPFYRKQGDDLNQYLRFCKGNSKKALLSYADELEAGADDLDKLAAFIEGKKLVVSSAGKQFIYLDGDKKALEEAYNKGLIDWEEW